MVNSRLTGEFCYLIKIKWNVAFNEAIMEGKEVGIFDHPILPKGVKILVNLGYLR